MTQVLIIEDDPDLAKGLADNLTFEGHEVTVAATGEDGLRQLRRRPFDVLLLDLMLPGIHGFDVLRAMQKEPSDTRVLVVSARDAEADIVRALDLGAHDYVRKPFGLSELLARVRAQLRERGNEPAQAGPQEFAFADVRISLPRYRLWKQEVEHLLSHTEAGLLQLFLAQQDQPLRRADILKAVWGNAYPTERTVDNFILKLRQKMEDDPHQPRYLRTVHGVGYCFTPGTAGDSETTATD